jgi:hypothetical protein
MELLSRLERGEWYGCIETALARFLDTPIGEHRLALLMRNLSEIKTSIERFAYGLYEIVMDETMLRGIVHFAKRAERLVKFSDLRDESSMASLWSWVHPDLPFCAERYRMLRDMNVQRDLASYRLQESMLEAVRASMEA